VTNAASSNEARAVPPWVFWAVIAVVVLVVSVIGARVLLGPNPTRRDTGYRPKFPPPPPPPPPAGGAQPGTP
jgi:U5 snRNP spliceosome subunit